MSAPKRPVKRRMGGGERGRRAGPQRAEGSTHRWRGGGSSKTSITRTAGCENVSQQAVESARPHSAPLHPFLGGGVALPAWALHTQDACDSVSCSLPINTEFGVDTGCLRLGQLPAVYLSTLGLALTRKQSATQHGKAMLGVTV